MTCILTGPSGGIGSPATRVATKEKVNTTIATMTVRLLILLSQGRDSGRGAVASRDSSKRNVAGLAETNMREERVPSGAHASPNGRARGSGGQPGCASRVGGASLQLAPVRTSLWLGVGTVIAAAIANLKGRRHKRKPEACATTPRGANPAIDLAVLVLYQVNPR